MSIFTRAAVRTALIAVLALVIGIVLTLVFTPHAGTAPPQTLEQRTVNGVCSMVVTSFDGEMWAAPLGESRLVRVDRASLGLTGCRTDPDRARP